MVKAMISISRGILDSCFAPTIEFLHGTTRGGRILATDYDRSISPVIMHGNPMDHTTFTRPLAPPWLWQVSSQHVPCKRCIIPSTSDILCVADESERLHLTPGV